MKEELKYNNGLWVSRSGDVYVDSAKEIPITFEEDINGYYFIPEDKLPIKSICSKITLPDGTTVLGRYVHRMVVFSFGDRRGVQYSERGYYDVVDHIDMNHKNNCVENLEFVSNGINLYRAFVKTKSTDCYDRFIKYYNTLDNFMQFHLQKEIEIEIKRRMSGK